MKDKYTKSFFGNSAFQSRSQIRATTAIFDFIVKNVKKTFLFVKYSSTYALNKILSLGRSNLFFSKRKGPVLGESGLQHSESLINVTSTVCKFRDTDHSSCDHS